MSRTCIICGNAAGSKEHVFPAALGGRRKNKGIYCHLHNQTFSHLVLELSNQLAPFNALLGIRPDRHDEPKSSHAVDAVTGEAIIHSIKRISFAEPRQIGQTQEIDGKQIVKMKFPDEKSLQSWIKAKKEQGFKVIQAEKSSGRTILDQYHVKMSLGGPEGMRSIAYILQSYFSENFPQTARSPSLEQLKQYTLGQVEKDFVWWDFDLPEDYPKNRFNFGHRIVVGVDSVTRQAFGRISFFSELHFAAHLGLVDPSEETHENATVIDIDPLADRPPNDVYEEKICATKLFPSRPNNLTSGLAEHIHSGGAERAIGRLLGRIFEHVAQCTSENIYVRAKESSGKGPEAVDLLFGQLENELAQRIYNLLSHTVKRFKAHIKHDLQIHKKLDDLIRLDPDSTNGLSCKAEESLNIAKKTLLEKIRKELQQGTLSQDRIVALISQGPGAAIVGEAVLKAFMESLTTGEKARMASLLP